MIPEQPQNTTSGLGLGLGLGLGSPSLALRGGLGDPRVGKAVGVYTKEGGSPLEEESLVNAELTPDALEGLNPLNTLTLQIRKDIGTDEVLSLTLTP